MYLTKDTNNRPSNEQIIWLYFNHRFFSSSCEEFPGTDPEELEEIEEAAVLGQFLTIPDQADNYADPELPAFFNLDTNTDPEKAGLVAFMKTLTDYELIEDEKFSNPFIEQ
ncbi:MAG: hypothetical protein JJ971_07265 [Balneolaceae bacterium]|nr:hypothetical protein [Balneolaceae bacterium]MBO6546968.1 hypothetical protein [Balneolaceae bacterium]MBO6649328.1 hypothetical protein [Balneolaceae bacterium]